MRANLKLVKAKAKQTGTHVRITCIIPIMDFMTHDTQSLFYALDQSLARSLINIFIGLSLIGAMLCYSFSMMYLLCSDCSADKWEYNSRDCLNNVHILSVYITFFINK